MPKYRFIHLSDIHFGQERDGTIFIHEDVRRELVRDCKAQASRIGPANGIIVTGDIAFSGKREEYIRAGEWLDRLTGAVQCDERAVCVIPGNHDVDLTQIDFMGGMVHERLRAATPQTVDSILDGIANSNEVGNPLLPKFSAYREFAARYDCDFESAQRPTWQRPFPLASPNVLQFIGLNGVQVSDRQDALGQMVLGKSQYVIPREDNFEYVVLVHHPLTWFKDRTNAELYLRRARVIMVGHEHVLQIRKVIWDNKSEHLEIFAGATNPPEEGGLYQFRYNWIEFDLAVPNDECTLVVSVYPRVWEPVQTCFVPDLARLNGQEVETFTLKCPRFSAPAETEIIPGSSVAPQAIDEVAAEHSDPELGNTDVTQDEAEHFARLRYFFWKYLDWHKRLEVLVKLDILPSTTSQPVPQTMERLALDAAERQGKLALLWSAVMDNVPEEKREDNPFTREEG